LVFSLSFHQFRHSALIIWLLQVAVALAKTAPAEVAQVVYVQQ
jgi:hypothetical protein